MNFKARMALFEAELKKADEERKAIKVLDEAWIANMRTKAAAESRQFLAAILSDFDIEVEALLDVDKTTFVTVLRIPSCFAGTKDAVKGALDYASIIPAYIPELLRIEFVDKDAPIYDTIINNMTSAHWRDMTSEVMEYRDMPITKLTFIELITND